MKKLKLATFYVSVLVVLPLALVLLFTPGDVAAWMWCFILWTTGVPALLPLLQYLGKDLASPGEQRDEGD